MLRSSLAAGWFEDVVAIDASSVGQVVVATAASEEEADELASGWSPSSNVVVSRKRWRLIVAKRWKEAEQINKLEVRAVSTAVPWVASRPSSAGARLLVLSDSAVVVGALSRVGAPLMFCCV